MGFNTTSYRVSKECDGTPENKLLILDSYEVGDLLCVLRSVEANPCDYDEAIVKRVYGRLFDKNIYCM